MTYALFPALLSYHFFAPLILRVILAITFIHFGKHKVRQSKEYVALKFGKTIGWLEVILGALLLVGIYTQLVAILISIILIIQLLHKIKSKAFLTDGINYYLILLVIAISLILTGPGRFAFDLPL